MATTSRQPKPARKGGPDPSRRPSAWSGARASPTFSPSSSSPRPQTNAAAAATQGSFPPLAQPNGTRSDNPRDRVLQSLAGLTGTTVTLLTKTSVRYEGVVASTSSEGDTTGVTLRDVKDLTSPGTPLKESIFIASTNIENYASGPADAKPANGDTFRTDTDISQKKSNAGRERELQAWLPDNDVPPTSAGDEDTFGATVNTSWDQFAVNEKLFGVTGGFIEEDYTTKLDRTAADYKERERKAQRIANEILGAATNNPHVAEERGLAVDDSGADEEDKYGAVVRGQNAYVPPGARRAGAGGALSPPSNVTTHSVNATAAPAPTAASKDKQDVPKVSVNGPDGAAITSPPDKTPSPAPGPTNVTKDAPAAFRDFVTNEKQRLTRKRQALVKSEMDKRMAELVKFSQSFKLNKPIPDDLVPILAKDEDKQRQIKEKAQKDAESTQARAIGASTAATASRGVGVAALKSSIKPAAAAGAPKPASSQTPAIAQKSGTGPTASKSDTAVKKIPMFIQSIPPFKGSKTKQSSSSAISISSNGANGNASTATSAASPAPMSPSTASANRLNVNASSFRPNPKANAFTPGGASPNAPAPAQNAASQNVVSPKPKSEPAPNPFFGVRPVKKSNITHIKDDFNPFKHSKVAEPNQITPQWPYHGKRYALMFPPLPHPPPQTAHMVPPVPQHMPPPSYEEDSAAQAAARGYVYAYPPYGYPAQHMMPGMAPPGPPGAYMPAPFMQPMPYPPGMPPPNAMYSPAMGQMPPYIAPPPPGAYPPPPNGAAPRPSMPPTPIPAHAHPYYHHQSPQLQHAVPYSMMMPPPAPGPPHPYENGPPPPVQMGGHA